MSSAFDGERFVVQTKFDTDCRLWGCPSGREREQICCLQAEPKWAYEWHIINSDWAEMMCELAKDRTKPFDREIMLPDKLHCTSHVVV